MTAYIDRFINAYFEISENKTHYSSETRLTIVLTGNIGLFVCFTISSHQLVFNIN